MINSTQELQAAKKLLDVYRIDSEGFDHNEIRLAVGAVMILAVADYGMRMTLGQRVRGAVQRAKMSMFSGYFATIPVEAAILAAYEKRLSPVEQNEVQS